MCEQELLAYKLKELFCKKSCCDDCCDICLIDCCKDKKSCEYCDCCVNPMEYLLKQFEYGDAITVFTGIGYDISDVVFLGVNDGILSVRAVEGTDNYIINIPVCKILAVSLPPEGEDIQDLVFLENRCKEDKGYCKCCEAPIRNQLKALIGHFVYIISQLIVFEGNVYSVHDGIVVLEDGGIYTAISTCKVDDIETINQLNGAGGAGYLKSKLSNIFKK